MCSYSIHRGFFVLVFFLHHFGVSIWIQSEQEQKWSDCLTVNLPSCVRNTPQIHRRFRLLIKDSRCPPLSGINYRQQKLIFEKKCFLPTLNHCSPLLRSPERARDAGACVCESPGDGDLREQSRK